MNYKVINILDDQFQNFVEEIFEFPTQTFDINGINTIYYKIQTLYKNEKDEEAISLIDKLNVVGIANNPDTFALFDSNNISSILLQYASSKYDFKYKRISILKIIDFTSSDDDRYKDKFLNLSILDRMKNYFENEKYDTLTPFIILEVSYLSNYKQTLEYFSYLNFDIDKFFDFLLKSFKVNNPAFMKSFRLFASIYDPVQQTDEILKILNYIDKIILKLPSDHLQLCDELLKYICELIEFDFFDDIIQQTQLVQHLINLLYSFDNITDTFGEKDFLAYLLALICYFSQDPECPEIQSSFLFNFFDNIKDRRISTYVICIIGNICKYKYKSSEFCSLIKTAEQRGFLKKLTSMIENDIFSLKMEAIICFSRIFSFSPKSMQGEIIENSEINILSFMQDLVDSLSYFKSCSNSDTLITILNLLEFSKQKLEYNTFINFIEEAYVEDIFELQFDEEDDEITAGQIKEFLESVDDTK